MGKGMRIEGERDVGRIWRKSSLLYWCRRQNNPISPLYGGHTQRIFQSRGALTGVNPLTQLHYENIRRHRESVRYEASSTISSMVALSPLQSTPFLISS